jgi:Fe-S-cluster-containing dehydrogenase component
MARYGLLIDVQKCTGCYNCFLACRDEYFGNPYPPLSAAQPLEGQFWMQIREVERGTYPKPKLAYIPIPCMQCAEAPCIAAAQDGAVYRRRDGIVIIDPVKAQGQEAIARACPYRVIFWNAAAQLPQKCTFCAHRLDEGAVEPRCVESCPVGALVFGDLEDPDSAAARLAAQEGFEAFHPEFGTRPAVRYRGLPRTFIAGEVVLRDKSDAGARGVRVVLEGAGTRRETASDPFGDFEFDGLEKNARYRIAIAHPGYAPRELEVFTRRDTDLGEVVLEPQR